MGVAPVFLGINMKYRITYQSHNNENADDGVSMSVESKDFSPIDKDDLYTRLISIGLNTINSSYNYRPEFQAIVDSFLSLPLSEFKGKWKYLEKGLKIKIVDKYDDEIFNNLGEK